MRLLLPSVMLLAACAVQAPNQPAPKAVDLVDAPPGGDVAAEVKQELQRAQHEGRQLLVYVGAKWCEPCKRFHEAARQGKLNPYFPQLRLLDFDSDRDSERLASAGYVSRLIPLFAVPNADGRASGRQMEGSIKGDGAVNEIVPRLSALLGVPARNAAPN